MDLSISNILYNEFIKDCESFKIVIDKTNES